MHASAARQPDMSDRSVTYYLRDANADLCEAWKSAFEEYKDNFKVSQGDIFRGAPAVDAIVSPANSFGIMGGGINLALVKHFGKQMQDRIQAIVRTSYRGELLIGQAVIIPAYENESMMKEKDLSSFNQGKPIKWMISAPTMRVGGSNVSSTVNAYLAFRAVLFAVRDHNNTPGNEPIKNVLVPGLATAIGRMHPGQCAWQMLQAYETVVMGRHQNRLEPESNAVIARDHKRLVEGRCGSMRQRRP